MDTPTKSQENLEEARRRHQAGDLQFATGVYREILSQDPENAEAMHLLGLAAHQMGNHAEALNLMQAAEAIEPLNLKIKSNIGSVYMATGESEKAATSFQAAQKLDPNDGELALNLGLAERACNRQNRHLRRLKPPVSGCRKTPKYGSEKPNKRKFSNGLRMLSPPIGVHSNCAPACCPQL